MMVFILIGIAAAVILYACAVAAGNADRRAGYKD